MSNRSPCVAGQFYPDDPIKLELMIRKKLHGEGFSRKAYAIMVPHAGYVYSGDTATKTMARATIPDTVILLGPNHTGQGRPLSVFSKGTWETPLGEVQIDEKLANELLNASPCLEANEDAHRFEHSLEVQVPILQVIKPTVKIVPIVMGSHDTELLNEVAHNMAEVLRGKDVLILSSSDMTHYESAESAEKKDKLAIDSILDLDETKLWNVVAENKISMCGIVPTFVTLIASKVLGAKEAELVEYTNSGEVSGDFDRVVGYAGVIIR